MPKESKSIYENELKKLDSGTLFTNNNTLGHPLDESIKVISGETSATEENLKKFDGILKGVYLHQ